MKGKDVVKAMRQPVLRMQFVIYDNEDPLDTRITTERVISLKSLQDLSMEYIAILETKMAVKSMLEAEPR